MSLGKIHGLTSVHVECEYLNKEYQNWSNDGRYDNHTGLIFYDSQSLTNLTIKARDVFLGVGIMFNTKVTEFFLECETLSFIHGFKTNDERWDGHITEVTAVFRYCLALKKVTLKCKKLNFSDIRLAEFCPNLTTVSISMDEIIDANPKKFYMFFKDLEALESVHINYTKPIELNKDTFKDCTKLSDLKLPRDVILNQYAFSGCSSLKKFVISDINEIIPRNAFFGCTSITSISIPQTVTTINEEAFKQSGITNIVIPPSVQEIKSGAFNNCSLESLTIPANFSDLVSKSNKFALRFANCANLRQIHIMGNIYNLSLKEEFHTFSKQVTIYFYGDQDLPAAAINPFKDIAVKVCVTPKYTKDKYANVTVDLSCRIISDETLLVEFNN